uniref:Uncharacterized protein n=1 Tax=Ditylenchus dipsaci TaxID=166011 RepID=A0A915DPI2_9BILA
MSSLGGQSAELLSAATTQDSMATLSTADRESISSTSKQVGVVAGLREQSWSKDVLKNSLSGFTDKKQKKQAIAMCKLVMEYMGDRKSKTMTDQ